MNKNCWIFRVMAKGSLQLQKHNLSYKKIFATSMLTLFISSLFWLLGALVWYAVNYGNRPLCDAPAPSFLEAGLYGIGLVIGLVAVIVIGDLITKVCIKCTNWASRNYRYSLLYEKHNVR